MNILGFEFTKFSLTGAAGMLAFGIADYLMVNWALVQGERQAQRDGSLDADKTLAFARVRTVLAVLCFLCFPVAGLFAGDLVLGALF